MEEYNNNYLWKLEEWVVPTVVLKAGKNANKSVHEIEEQV